MNEAELKKFEYLFKTTNELEIALRNPGQLSQNDIIRLLSDICSTLTKFRESPYFEKVINPFPHSREAEIKDLAKNSNIYIGLLEIEREWFNKTNLSDNSINLLIELAHDLREAFKLDQYDNQKTVEVIDRFTKEVCSISFQLNDQQNFDQSVQNFIRGTGIVFGLTFKVVNTAALFSGPAGQLIATASYIWGGVLLSSGFGAETLQRLFYRR